MIRNFECKLNVLKTLGENKREKQKKILHLKSIFNHEIKRKSLNLCGKTFCVNVRHISYHHVKIDKNIPKFIQMLKITQMLKKCFNLTRGTNAMFSLHEIFIMFVQVYEILFIIHFVLKKIIFFSLSLNILPTFALITN